MLVVGVVLVIVVGLGASNLSASNRSRLVIVVGLEEPEQVMP